jgi:hypothetical protein
VEGYAIPDIAVPELVPIGDMKLDLQRRIQVRQRLLPTFSPGAGRLP